MKKKILVRGPALSQSGYGEHARMILRALKEREDLLDVFIVPTGWGHTGWLTTSNGQRMPKYTTSRNCLAISL
jgi:hypothetical protein